MVSSCIDLNHSNKCNVLGSGKYISLLFFESFKYNQITIFKVIFSAASGLFLVIYLNYGAFGAVLSSFISFSISLFITFYFFFNKKRYVFHFSWEWAKKIN